MVRSSEILKSFEDVCYVCGELNSYLVIDNDKHICFPCYLTKNKGGKTMTEVGDYQFPECETCQDFPCSHENLWQFNGKCMDFNKKEGE